MSKDKVVRIISTLYNSKLEDSRLNIDILLLVKRREVIKEELITNEEMNNKQVDNYKIETS